MNLNQNQNPNQHQPEEPITPAADVAALQAELQAFKDKEKLAIQKSMSEEQKKIAELEEKLNAQVKTALLESKLFKEADLADKSTEQLEAMALVVQKTQGQQANLKNPTKVPRSGTGDTPLKPKNQFGNWNPKSKTFEYE